MTDCWCFSAVLQGQTLPLETGLEAVLNAEAISIEKTDAGHSLIMAWLKMSLTLNNCPQWSAGL